MASLSSLDADTFAKGLDKVKVEVMVYYRMNSRAKSYTKDWWLRIFEPILLSAGLVMTSEGTFGCVRFYGAELSYDEALALRRSLQPYQRRVSFGMIFTPA